MTLSAFKAEMKRVFSSLTSLLKRSFGLGGHEYITSASSATGETKYHWLVALEETTFTYTDCITGTEHTVTVPQFFEVGGTMTDIEVTSGELLAYKL